MFPSEMVILMAIAQTRDCGKGLLARPMDITGEYIAYLCNSLVRRGYIEGNHSRGFHLTAKGKQALAEFVRYNGSKVRDAIKTLQQLGIAVSHEIDKLEKEKAATVR